MIIMMQQYRLFMLFLLVTLLSKKSTAQAHKLAVKSMAINRIPATLRKQTPAGFKTLQHGCNLYKVGPDNSYVLLHLYILPKRNSRYIYLDLYIHSHNSLRRINSVRLVQKQVGELSSEDVKSPNIGNGTAPITWLNIKNKRIPMIPVQVPDNSGFNQGHYWLLIFTQGLNKKPIIQKFEYFIGLQANRNVYLDRIDERGYVVVHSYYSRTGGGPEYVEIDDRYYYWNGYKFEEKRKR